MTYGAKVGNQIVFTRQGAIEVYRAALEVCYNHFDYPGALMLSNIQRDLTKIGFDWDEIESMEIAYLSNC